MKVGFLVAMENEYFPFLTKLGFLVNTEVLCGIEFCMYSSDNGEIVLAKCGIGEIASSAATSLLIGHFGCGVIVNFGLVGALVDLPKGGVVLVKDVVHYDCDLTPFGRPLGEPAGLDVVAFPASLSDFAIDSSFPLVRLASGDKFVADPERKEWIKANFSADICDMEGAGVAITAYRAGVPFIMIKLVSDAAGEGAVAEFTASKEKAFDFAVDFVLSVIARR